MIGDLPLFLLVLALSVIGFTEPSPVYARTVTAYSQLQAVLDSARGESTLHALGATLYIHTVGDATAVVIYPAEPANSQSNPGGTPTNLSAPIQIDGISNGAIFIDPDGTVREQNGWTPWSTVATPPSACSTSMNVQSTYVGYPTFGTLDCTSTD